MRAIGSSMINGDYKDGETKDSFHESIDLDILAQLDKITDKREFHVKVEDFDYSFNEGNLALVIQASVYGVKDDEDRVIEAQTTRISEDSDEDIASEIEDLLREEVVDIKDVVDVKEVDTPLVDMQIVTEEPVVQNISSMQVVSTEKHIEADDSMEDEDDLGTYYLYVVQDGDSYQSIAAHYQTDEYRLKEYNHERSLDKGTIVIVPYYS
ncbi:MAG: LysM peptidoglycan-binding domain-containing protein [Coprobacillus sp.]